MGSRKKRGGLQALVTRPTRKELFFAAYLTLSVKKSLCWIPRNLKDVGQIKTSLEPPAEGRIQGVHIGLTGTPKASFGLVPWESERKNSDGTNIENPDI